MLVAGYNRTLGFHRVVNELFMLKAPAIMVQHLLDNVIPIDLSGQRLDLRRKQVSYFADVLRFINDLDDLLKRACAVHVFAEFDRIFLSCLDYLRKHAVVGYLNNSLSHVVAERIHHQLEETLDRAIEYDLDICLVVLED